MSRLRPSLIAIVLPLLVWTASGCNMLPHNLQFHRLWRLNRHPPTQSRDVYYSVNDPLPSRTDPEKGDEFDASQSDRER